MASSLWLSFFGLLRRERPIRPHLLTKIRSCLYVYFHLHCAPTKRMSGVPELFGRVSLAGLTSCLIQKPDPYILCRSLERACPEANSGGLPVRSAESGSSASRFVLPLSPSATSHRCHLFPIPHWRCNKR